mgnify:CR=1
MGYMDWQATVAGVDTGPELRGGLFKGSSSSAVVGRAAAVRSWACGGARTQ